MNSPSQATNKKNGMIASLVIVGILLLPYGLMLLGTGGQALGYSLLGILPTILGVGSVLIVLAFGIATMIQRARNKQGVDGGAK
jgi:hypothetical protein